VDAQEARTQPICSGRPVTHGLIGGAGDQHAGSRRPSGNKRYGLPVNADPKREEKGFKEHLPLTQTETS
jgi:hypothetical protein